MRYYGSYEEAGFRQLPAITSGADPAGFSCMWGCSLFAALGDTGNMLYARNFDWEYSPALLLFTDPPEGYASASMVDLAYLGFSGAGAAGLTDLPLVERRGLLNAPFLPFDGMNEHGLAIGMAAVPSGRMLADPAKDTVGSLTVMRRILDYADDVDEAVASFGSYNIDMRGGPSIHYLIADPSGRAVLVEFREGQMVVIPNKQPWLHATNFLLASTGGFTEGKCWRYDAIGRRLRALEGRITAREAMNLLSAVSQADTQWSVVYGIDTSDMSLSMARQYSNVYAFPLGRPAE
jgi:hypothetical protein